MSESVVTVVTIGPYTFREVRCPWLDPKETGWRFQIEDLPTNSTVYPTLDYAMVSAVGERWTGRAMAGGLGVNTAAGWFMRMIGAE